MAVGMLIFLQGNQWVARVTNSMTGLNFSGATTSEQWQNVKSLANAMKGGDSEARFMAQKVFNPPDPTSPDPGADIEAAFNPMIDDSSVLYYQAAEAFVCDAGRVISDQIIEAAEALLALL